MCNRAQGQAAPAATTPLLFPFTRAFGHTATATEHDFAGSLLVEQPQQLNCNTTTKGTCLTVPGEVRRERDADYKTTSLFP